MLRSSRQRTIGAVNKKPQRRYNSTAPKSAPTKSKKDTYKLAMKVPTKHHQTRVDQFLHHSFPTLTTKALSKMIKKKEITITKATSIKAPLQIRTITSQGNIQELIQSLDDLGRDLGNSFQPNTLLHPILPHSLTQLHLPQTTATPINGYDIPSFLATQFRELPGISKHTHGVLEGSAVIESGRVAAGDFVMVPPWLSHLHPDPSIQTLHKLISTPELLTSLNPDSQSTQSSQHQVNVSTKQSTLPKTTHTQPQQQPLTPEQQQIVSLLRSIPPPAPIPSSFTELDLLTDNNQSQTALFDTPYMTPSFSSSVRSLKKTPSANTNTPTNTSSLPLRLTPIQRPKTTRHFQQLLTDVKKLQKMALYSDPYLFCINKPSGISVHASDFQTQKRNISPTSNSRDQDDFIGLDTENDGWTNIQTGSEHHIDSLLESAHQLSQHYTTFTTLVQQLQQEHIPTIPYSLSEIQSLSRIATEGSDYYSRISKANSPENNHHPQPQSSSHSQIPIISLLSPDPPRLVHRLDKATSGVLTIAKSRLVAKTLSKMFHALSTSSSPQQQQQQQQQQQPALSPNEQPYDASKLLHKVYLAITFTHPLAATEALQAIHSQKRTTIPAKTMVSHNNPKINPNSSSLKQQVPVFKQSDLTFPNLFGSRPVIKTEPFLQSTSRLDTLAYPSLSPLQMHNPSNFTAILTNNNVSQNLTSVQLPPSQLDNPKSISFPTAPYIELSTTQQRISPYQRKKSVSMQSKTDSSSTPPDLKQSTSLYKILHVNPLCSLIAFSPVTGHFHQLRIQSASKEGLQAPILGDEKYITPNLLQTKTIMNKPGVGIIEGNDSLPSHLLGTIWDSSMGQQKSGDNGPNLVDYYSAVHQQLGSDHGQYHSSPVNTNKLYLVSHSLSFPHPIILSHSLDSSSSQSRLELMPVDKTELDLAQKWFKATTTTIFPSASYSPTPTQTTTVATSEILQNGNNIPMLTVTCDLPNWFTSALNSIGVKVM